MNMKSPRIPQKSGGSNWISLGDTGFVLNMIYMHTHTHTQPATRAHTHTHLSLHTNEHFISSQVMWYQGSSTVISCRKLNVLSELPLGLQNRNNVTSTCNLWTQCCLPKSLVDVSIWFPINTPDIWHQKDFSFNSSSTSPYLNNSHPSISLRPSTPPPPRVQWINKPWKFYCLNRPPYRNLCVSRAEVSFFVNETVWVHTLSFGFCFKLTAYCFLHCVCCHCCVSVLSFLHKALLFSFSLKKWLLNPFSICGSIFDLSFLTFFRKYIPTDLLLIRTKSILYYQIS